MSLRETINRNPTQSAVISGAIVVVAIVVLYFTVFRSSSSGSAQFLPTKNFFSDDDGKTYYIDDMTNIPPYDHNGKKAYIAKVFMTKDGPKFVGYLESYDDKDKKRITDAMQKNNVPPSQAMQGIDVLVKKPLGGKWVKIQGASMLEIMRAVKITPPGGKEGDEIFPVRPTASDMAK